MRVISRRNVMQAAARHPRSVVSVERWLEVVEGAAATNLVQLREVLPNADQAGSALVFNIGRNNYRLICCVDWKWQRLFFRALLTHAEYDRVDIEELCRQ